MPALCHGRKKRETHSERQITTRKTRRRLVCVAHVPHSAGCVRVVPQGQRWMISGRNFGFPWQKLYFTSNGCYVCSFSSCDNGLYFSNNLFTVFVQNIATQYFVVRAIPYTAERCKKGTKDTRKEGNIFYLNETLAEQKFHLCTRKVFSGSVSLLSSVVRYTPISTMPVSTNIG